MIATGTGGEADLETRHGADANESPLYPLRPRHSLGCEMEPADSRFVDQPVISSTPARDHPSKSPRIGIAPMETIAPNPPTPTGTCR
jgi:hypothetical protein